MECFWYNCTIINCLLTIFVHNYYSQPMYYTDVSKCCECLTDWKPDCKSEAVSSLYLQQLSRCGSACWVSHQAFLHKVIEIIRPENKNNKQSENVRQVGRIMNGSKLGYRLSQSRNKLDILIIHLSRNMFLKV